MPTAMRSPPNSARHLAHEVERLRGARADDHARHAGLQRARDGFRRAHAAAELARDADRRDDRADGVEIARLAGEGGIEIDDVQVIAAFRFPAARKGGGIARVDGLFLGLALPQAHHFAAP